MRCCDFNLVYYVTFCSQNEGVRSYTLLKTSLDWDDCASVIVNHCQERAVVGEIDCVIRPRGLRNSKWVRRFVNLWLLEVLRANDSFEFYPGFLGDSFQFHNHSAYCFAVTSSKFSLIYLCTVLGRLHDYEYALGRGSCPLLQIVSQKLFRGNSLFMRLTSRNIGKYAVLFKLEWLILRFWFTDRNSNLVPSHSIPEMVYGAIWIQGCLRQER